MDLPPIKLESGKPVAKIELPPNLNQERGESLWLTALRIVRKEINQHTYETWLVPTKALGTDGSDLYIRVPTEEFIHLGEKFGKELYSVLKPMGICQLKFIPKAIAS